MTSFYENDLDYVVVEWGCPEILCCGSFFDCCQYIDSDFVGRDLVILYGKEDIPTEWT